MILNNNSIKPPIESWFIPIDILMIICTSFVVLVALIFLLIIIFDKRYRTVPMMLLSNSFLSELIFGCIMLSMGLFTFSNDIKGINYEDSFCVFRGYMSYSLSSVRSHSYLIQSIYRYINIISPTNLYYQSFQFEFLLICLTWLISLIHPLPFLLTNKIKYNVDNQICHMPFESSLFIFYTCFLSYLNPITIIIIIYFKLVRYVQKMNKLVTPVNQLLRIQRELKMVRRIIMLLIVLITLGLPYTIFFLISFFTNPPKYHFRLAFLSVDLSLVCVIIALIQFADPIQTVITKKINQLIYD